MTTSPATTTQPPRRRDRTHWLYIAVSSRVGLGIAVGLALRRAVALSRSATASSR